MSNAKRFEPTIGTTCTWPVLSELGRQLVIVHCSECNRMGKRRADAIRAELGDLNLPEVAIEMAKAGGCKRALNPPLVTDLEYNLRKCQVRRLAPSL